MKLTFCLRDAKASGETPIHCYVHFQPYQLKIATGCKIHPKNWNQERRRAKRGTTGEATVNSTLAKMEADIAGIFAALTATGVKPTPEIVKERYAALSGRKQAERPADLFAAYDQFIERNGFRPSTKTNHRKAKNHLTKFAKTYTLRLTFDRLDRLFWERFGAYLLTVEQMTNDSAWNVLKSIRAFLNDAVERGLTTTEDFRKVTRKSLPKGETSDKPYLTFEELERVRNLDLTDDARLDRVRDLFVFLCYTGVRFGDSQQLRPENIDGDMIRLTLEKNRKAVTVPLLDPARKILDKYERTLPRISNQKANDYLKEVLRKAEINTKCQVVRHSGTERREVIASKYELCGMHTAKRTYVSLLRQRGVSVEALMKATGNSRATLERYILRTDAEALEEIREAWA
jgi:integrase